MKISSVGSAKNLFILVQIFFCLLLIYSISAFSAPKPTEAYKLSMENDAQFIESVAELFNGLANLQRTIVEELQWTKGNPEKSKIDQAIKDFTLSREHLKNALSNSDRLLKSLDKERAQKFKPQLQEFKNKISDLDVRLSKIIASLKKNGLPDRPFIHETIKLALAGVGFGMEVSKNKEDPGKDSK